MAIYLRNTVWHYEFELGGRRYRGSTKQTDREDAAGVEAREKLNVRRASMGLPPHAAVPRVRASQIRLHGRLYFIRCDQFVKIGWAHNVKIRLRELQIGCPFQLQLLLHVPATEREERAVHQLFAEARARGEWFKLTSDLRALIRELRANKDRAPEIIAGPRDRSTNADGDPTGSAAGRVVTTITTT